MRFGMWAPGWGVLIAATLLGCASGIPAPSSEMSPHAEEDMAAEAVLLGELSREEIERALPDWFAAQIEAEVDLETAERLMNLAFAGDVTVYFGSWCSDSRRELARLWRAIDSAGGETRFPIRYIGVDRSKAEPAELVGDLTILYVPTFIVSQGDRELGRIIESAPAGIETELLKLLNGEASGWISGRDDLPEPAVADG